MNVYMWYIVMVLGLVVVLGICIYVLIEGHGYSIYVTIELSVKPLKEGQKPHV